MLSLQRNTTALTGPLQPARSAPSSCSGRTLLLSYRHGASSIPLQQQLLLQQHQGLPISGVVRYPSTSARSSPSDFPLPLSSPANDALPLYTLAEGLETPIQLMYLIALLGFLSVGAFLVVRQVLIRRELDEAAKGLGERIRTGEATCEVNRGLLDVPIVGFLACELT